LSQTSRVTSSYWINYNDTQLEAVEKGQTIYMGACADVFSEKTTFTKEEQIFGYKLYMNDWD